MTGMFGGVVVCELPSSPPRPKKKNVRVTEEKKKKTDKSHERPWLGVRPDAQGRRAFMKGDISKIDFWKFL